MSIRSRIALLGAALMGVTGLGKLLVRGERAVSTVQDERPIASAPPTLTASAKRWAPIGGGVRECARRRRQIERGNLKCSLV
ncbi:hypothetical protein B0T40_03205 [Chromobacterium haemolyticum]|uniref:hypothetical protein n=1 Tax=Chromobacterium haemolyticum TaxID=394935 RepID=UPI0009DA31D3|nr:hypothetical protein [Chromobacterium haemolyticum]OQS39756.1 hypothetical protein B0T40_03205 [Chromobacterium haemolyticum]